MAAHAHAPSGLSENYQTSPLLEFSPAARTWLGSFPHLVQGIEILGCLQPGLQSLKSMGTRLIELEHKVVWTNSAGPMRHVHRLQDLHHTLALNQSLTAFPRSRAWALDVLSARTDTGAAIKLVGELISSSWLASGIQWG